MLSNNGNNGNQISDMNVKLRQIKYVALFSSNKSQFDRNFDFPREKLSKIGNETSLIF